MQPSTTLLLQWLQQVGSVLYLWYRCTYPHCFGRVRNGGFTNNENRPAFFPCYVVPKATPIVLPLLSHVTHGVVSFTNESTSVGTASSLTYAWEETGGSGYDELGSEIFAVSVEFVILNTAEGLTYLAERRVL